MLLAFLCINFVGVNKKHSLYTQLLPTYTDFFLALPHAPRRDATTRFLFVSSVHNSIYESFFRYLEKTASGGKNPAFFVFPQHLLTFVLNFG